MTGKDRGPAILTSLYPPARTGFAPGLRGKAVKIGKDSFGRVAYPIERGNPAILRSGKEVKPTTLLCERKEVKAIVANNSGQSLPLPDAPAAKALGCEQNVRRETSDQSALILHAVAEHAGLTVDELLSNSAKRRIARPRQTAAWLMRQAGMSLPATARALALADHTSALYSVRRIETLRAENIRFREATDALREQLGDGAPC